MTSGSAFACVLVAVAGLGCGYTEEEMQVKRERIELLTHTIERLDLDHRALEDRFKALAGDAADSDARLRQCMAGAGSAAEVPTPALGVSDTAPLIASFDGVGAMTTRPFTAQGPWEIFWVAEGNVGAFTVLIRGSGDGGALTQDLSKSNHGSTYNADPGTYYFSVLAPGRWRIDVHYVNRAPAP